MNEELIAVIIAAIKSYNRKAKYVKIFSIQEQKCSKWITHTPYVFWRARKG